MPGTTRRPTSVTLLAVMVLTFAAFCMARFYNALARWDYLVELLPFSPAYLAATGLVWGVAGLAAAWGLWFGRSWARRLFWIVFLSYAVYFALDRWLMPGDPDRNSNLAFWIGFFIVVVLLSWWSLYRKKAQLYFQKGLPGSQA